SHGDVLGLGLRRDVHRLRQIDLHRLVDHRDRDQEDDEQHQHDVDQRRRVDGRYGPRIIVPGRGTHAHRHVLWLLAGLTVDTYSPPGARGEPPRAPPAVSVGTRAPDTR